MNKKFSRLLVFLTLCLACCFTACGINSGNSHTHIPGECVQFDQLQHMYLCAECGDECYTEPHEFEITDGEYVCGVCGYVHQHYSIHNKYGYDDQTHWFEADCGHDVKINEQEHNWSNGDWGYCECGASKDQAHTHAFNGRYTADISSHWQICEYYDCPDPDSIPKTPHTFVDGVCNVCGAPQIAEDTGTAGLEYTIDESEPRQFAKYAYLTGWGTATGTEIEVASVYQNYPVAGITLDLSEREITKLTLPSTIGLHWQDGTIEIPFATLRELRYKGTQEQWLNINQSFSFPGGYDIDFEEWDDSYGYDLYFNDQLVTQVTFADDGAYTFFIGCKSIESVQFADEVTYIQSYLFAYCRNLSNVHLPTALESIGTMTFYQCPIETLELPDKVTKLEKNQFSCLKEIKLGADFEFDVQKILSYGSQSYFASEEADLLRSVSVSARNSSCSSYSGVLYNKEGTEIYYVPMSITEAEVPRSLTLLPQSVSANVLSFRYHTQLKTLILHDYISFDANEFSIKDEYGNTHYPALQGFEQNGGKYVSTNDNQTAVLYDLTDKSAETFVCADSCRTVSDGVFVGCDKLKSITLPSSMHQITYAAFYENTTGPEENALESITIADSNLYFKSEGGILYSKYKTGLTGSVEAYKVVCVPKGIKGEVTLIDNVETILVRDMCNCANITTLKLSESITTIEGGDSWNDYFLSGFDSLRSLYAPVAVYNYLVDYGRYHLQDITYAEILRSDYSIKNCVLDGSAFNGQRYDSPWKSLTELKIGDLNEISRNAISRLPKLSKLTIGADKIDAEAVTYCDALSELHLDGTVEWQTRAVANCANLRTVTTSKNTVKYTAQDNVLYLNDNSSSMSIAFVPEMLCGAITIPDKVNSIPGNAFASRVHLTEVTLGSGVTEVDAQAFSGCTSLACLSAKANGKFFGKDGVLYKHDTTDTVSICYVPVALRGEIEIDSRITQIKDGLFAGTYINSIVLPENLTEIEENAFEGCKLLVEVINLSKTFTLTAGDCGMPEDCQVFTDREGANRITDKDGLLFVQNNDTVELIGYKADEISNDLVLPVKYNEVYYKIRENALLGANIKSITLPFIGAEVNPPDDNSNQRLIYIFGKTLPHDLKTVKMHDGVDTKIGSYAFFELGQLTSIVLGDGVTSIGSQAFYRCYGLTQITIPASVKEISTNWVFEQCENLQKIDVVEGNTKFSSQDGILYNGDKTKILEVPIALKGEITVSGSAKVIDKIIFCDNVTSLKFEEGVTEIRGALRGYKNASRLKLSLPNSLEILEDGVLDSSGGSYLPLEIDKTTDTDGTTYIGNETNPYVLLYSSGVASESFAMKADTKVIYAGAFRSSEKLKSFTFNSVVTCICDSAFQATSLTEVILPDSVKLVDKYAFAECKQLTKVKIPKGAKVGFAALGYCPALETVAFNPQNIDDDYSKTLAYLVYSESRDENNSLYYPVPNGSTVAYIPLSLKTVVLYGNPFKDMFMAVRLDNVVVTKDVTEIPESFVSSEYTQFYMTYPVKNIFYCGTQSEWESLNVSTENDLFTNDTAHWFYSDGAAQGSGNYWHFDADGFTPVKGAN